MTIPTAAFVFAAFAVIVLAFVTCRAYRAIRDSRVRAVAGVPAIAE